MFKRVKQFRVGAMHFSQTASEQSGVSPLPRSAIGRVHIVRPILRRSTHLYLNHSLFTTSLHCDVSPLPRSAVGRVHIIRPILRPTCSYA